METNESMSRRYSPIKDLYGVSPPEETPRRRGRVWLLVLLVLAGLFVYQSIRPVTRLRPDPPLAFMGAKLNASGAEDHSQERMARACWDYAIQYLQDSYPFGDRLPESPSLGFVKAPEIRIQCWPRLRQAWTRPESWVRSYQWNTNWLTNPHSSFQKNLRNLWDELGVSR